jgi:protein-disulfide isomerase
MPIMRRCLVAFVTMLVPLLACAGQAADESGGGQVLARYGDQSITKSQLEQQQDYQLQLTAIKQQEYDATRDYLEQMIFERLVDGAAAKAGLTREAYLKREIDDKAGQPPDAQVDQLVAAYRSRLNPDPDKARAQVVTLLTQQRQQQRRDELEKELFASADVQILLEPVRFHPDLTGRPSRGGGEDAPVTLVEYSDYQCPFCGRIQPILDELVSRYGDKLRHVYKQLPLPMHANAQKAAEASLCAQDQGKFWELHHWMFTHQGKLDRDSLVDEAKTLGMNGDTFASCLDSGRHAADVQRDEQEAHSYGITGTPGFLVNGRAIQGAQPMSEFVKVIDDELERAGVAVPPAPTPAEPTAAK